MKRSEACNLIADFLNNNTYLSKFRVDQRANELLTLLESAGMIPPETNGTVTLEDGTTLTTTHFEWDKENE